MHNKTRKKLYFKILPFAPFSIHLSLLSNLCTSTLSVLSLFKSRKICLFLHIYWYSFCRKKFSFSLSKKLRRIFLSPPKYEISLNDNILSGFSYKKNCFLKEKEIKQWQNKATIAIIFYLLKMSVEVKVMQISFFSLFF